MKKALRLFPTLLAGSALLYSELGATPGDTTTHQGDIMNVCDLERIYNDEFKYSMPKNLVEDFMAGKGFPGSTLYSEQETSDLKEDIKDIWDAIISKKPEHGCTAVITAGGPGAGKTIKMTQDLAEEKKEGREIAYIDPDDVCLKLHMTRTYKKFLEEHDESFESRKAAYDYWRPGSNAANHIVLANLIREKYNFYFGTTATGAPTAFFFKFLKDQGYKINLIHVSAPDDVRWASIQKRDETFVQTTEQDVKEKGLLLPQRINDTYLKYADTIEFCYRGNVNEDAIPAATWIRGSEGALKLGTLFITDKERYEKIIAIHNTALETLNKPTLRWEETVESVSEIVGN